MSNSLLGEMSIKLNEIDYNLKLSINVIAKYEEMTGGDFFADAYKALDAMVKAAECKDNPTAYASILTSAVSRTQAAWLVFLAAKEGNSVVEFGEIQEAFIVDHSLNDDRFHPAIFTTLAMFAINGKSKAKKKESLKRGSAKRKSQIQ